MIGACKFVPLLLPQKKLSVFSPAVAYMILATMSFGVMNASVKFLTNIPVAELVFFRALVQLAMGYANLKRLNMPVLGTHYGSLVLRGLYGSVGLFLYFYTLKTMNLGTAVVIQYLAPIFTALLAFFMAGERVYIMQWVFFGMSFGGVLMVKGFDKVETVDFIAGLVSAIFSALAYNQIKRLKGKEEPQTVVFYFPLVTLPLSVIFMIFSPESWVTPEGFDWLWLLITGISTQMGQIFMTRAYQMDQASKVASVNYVGLLWASLFGVFLFGEVYPFWVLVGMALMLLGVILNVNYLKIHKRFFE